MSEHALRDTSTAEAPWIVVEATDARYRSLTVGRSLLDAIEQRLERASAPVARAAPPPPPAIDARSVLQEFDMDEVAERAPTTKLPMLQARLNALVPPASRLGDHGRASSCSRGTTRPAKGARFGELPARSTRAATSVVPVAAPTEEERAQPYLWRFWRHVPPRRARRALRSQLVRPRARRARRGPRRRVGLDAGLPRDRRLRASLARFGVVVVKFWLQSRRTSSFALQISGETPFKRYKITREDWRNRKKWDAYGQAVCDVVDRTSTDLAPWHLIEANDKKWARVKVLQTICASIEEAIG